MIAAAAFALGCRSRPSAVLLRDGGGGAVSGPADAGQSLESLSRACDLGNGSACMFAGRLYEFAHGLDRDVGKALALYERSCSLGFQGGCYNEAVVLEPRNPARAAALYRQVCTAGSPIACAAASKLAMDGGRP
jgi:TPR repeat protein